MTSPQERAFELAEELAARLSRGGVRSALIGAAAMAVHGYIRTTEDIDLGTAVTPSPTLSNLGCELEEEGYEVELRYPDADDPLGGVLDVRREGMDLVQIVNFCNPLSRGASGPGIEAINQAEPWTLMHRRRRRSVSCRSPT